MLIKSNFPISLSWNLKLCDYKSCTQIFKYRPRVGEMRTVSVERSSEPLGIQIESGGSGGIFVSSISEHSLASKSGVTIGDQLLDVSTSYRWKHVKRSMVEELGLYFCNFKHVSLRGYPTTYINLHLNLHIRCY